MLGFESYILRGRIETKSRKHGGHAQLVSGRLYNHRAGRVGDGMKEKMYYAMGEDSVCFALLREQTTALYAITSC